MIIEVCAAVNLFGQGYFEAVAPPVHNTGLFQRHTPVNPPAPTAAPVEGRRHKLEDVLVLGQLGVEIAPPASLWFFSCSSLLPSVASVSPEGEARNSWAHQTSFSRDGRRTTCPLCHGRALVYDGIYVHSVFVDIKKSGQLWAAHRFCNA